jgi:cell division protein FtsQ
MRELLATGRARLLASVAAIAVLGITALGVTYTPVFRARHIDVEGEDTLTTAQVLRIAGVNDGTNVFHLDPSAVEASLRSSPWIADAEVVRDLPSTIQIRITEREPVAIVTIDGVTQPVAGDGTVLPGDDTSNLPEVRASAGTLDAAAWTDAARALAAMPRPIWSRVRAVVVATDGSLTVRLDANLDVSYGPAGGEAAKAAALHAILAWAAQDGVSLATIDVTVPGAPTATTTDGGTVAP